MDLLSAIQANPIAQGSLLTLLTGFIIGIVYKYGSVITELIKSIFISEMQVTSYKDDDSYQALNYWLHSNKSNIKSMVYEILSVKDSVSKREKYVSSSVTKKVETNSDYIFTFGVGTHLLIYNKKLLIINKFRNNNRTGEGSMGHPIEIITMKKFGRGLDIFQLILNEALEAYTIFKNDKIIIHNFAGYSIRDSQREVYKRPLSSVILKNNKEQKILQEIYNFLDRKDWYLNNGINYKRTYLLHGLAGTGKTSIIKAIASELGWDIYSINLSDVLGEKNNANKILYEIPQYSVIAIEDVHTFFSTPESINTNIQTILSFLDGLNTPEGCIIFLTANTLENIPEVMLRTGRVDERVYFDYLDYNQIVDITTKYIGENKVGIKEFAHNIKVLKLTPSELQEALITHYDGSLINVQENIVTKNK